MNPVSGKWTDFIEGLCVQKEIQFAGKMNHPTLGCAETESSLSS